MRANGIVILNTTRCFAVIISLFVVAFASTNMATSRELDQSEMAALRGGDGPVDWECQVQATCSTCVPVGGCRGIGSTACPTHYPTTCTEPPYVNCAYNQDSGETCSSPMGEISFKCKDQKSCTWMPMMNVCMLGTASGSTPAYTHCDP